MPGNDLVRFRRQQRTALRRIEKLELLLAEYRGKLAAIEARMMTLSPERPLEIKRRKPNRIFRSGESYPGSVMREEGAPMPARLIATRCLAAKAVAHPGSAPIKRTHVRLQRIFFVWEWPGMVYSVGSKRETRRGLRRNMSVCP